MSNQVLLAATILAALVIAFFAPAAYFDHKVDECVEAYQMSNPNMANLAFAKVTCVAQANGAR